MDIDAETYAYLEDNYRKRWEKQNKLDAVRNPTAFQNKAMQNGLAGAKKNRETGNLGGRPRAEPGGTHDDE